MRLRTLLLTISISFALAACATGKRERPNLAIDSDVAPPPAARTTTTSSEAPTDEPAPKGEINLGLTGGGGQLVVEGALTEEEQEALEAEAEAENADEEEAATEASEDDESPDE